jgi:hypothetical protein
MTMDPALQRLIDENEIRRLVLTWFDGIDNHDPERIQSAWAEDVYTEYVGFPDMGTPPIKPGFGKMADRAKGAVRMLEEFTAHQHVNTNHLVEVNGDEAFCSSYGIGTHYLKMDMGDPWSTMGVRYEVHAERRPEGWRLTRLKWILLWMSGNDGIWQEVARRLAKARAEGRA